MGYEAELKYPSNSGRSAQPVLLGQVHRHSEHHTTATVVLIRADMHDWKQSFQETKTCGSAA